MFVEAQVTIHGSQAAAWAAITDIERAAELIRGIEKIEVLDTPAQGLVGLRWRETRILFGKPASAEKWITEATEPEAYTARAEDNGFVFTTTLRLAERDGVLTLTSSHLSEPRTLAAKLMSIPMGLLFRGVAKKAILQDLQDIKAEVERGRPKAP